MTQKSLRERVDDLEDGLTERKRGFQSKDEIRKAVVSFANSVPEDRTAVLYLGVDDDGNKAGISDGDVVKFQEQVRRVCGDDCFPPVVIKLAEALKIDGKNILAFEFGPSKSKPHFTGHAYIRGVSQSEKASAAKLDELIASRNTKAGRLLAAKEKYEQLTLVLPVRSHIPGEHPFSQRRNLECVVESCDAHTVIFRDLGLAGGRTIPLPVEYLIFAWDRQHNRFLVEYTKIG